MLRVILILTAILLALGHTCSGEQVLKKHVSNVFTSKHNKHRPKNPLTWSSELSVSAHTEVLRLATYCWINSTGNGVDANVMQVWGARTYTPDQVIQEWMKDESTRRVILDTRLKELGCAYRPCKDPGSYATSIIYICNYR